tara:strand:- start:5264 stop:5635 length:372 start_codon:yes stop_codon:yes gene_type:complete
MLKKLVKVNLLILFFLLSTFFFLPIYKATGLFLGALLSTSSILVSAWILDTFWDSEWNQFNKIFFFSLIGRFITVLIIIGILLGVTKIDEIYFTVSFIISYLYNSITEMILFNKILDKKSSKQ